MDEETTVYIETEFTSSSSSSDSDIETDVCGSPRAQRKKRQKNFRPEKVERSTTFRTLNELFYNDSLPEVSKPICSEENLLFSGSHRPGKVLEFDLGPGKLLEFEKVPFVLELSWNFVKSSLKLVVEKYKIQQVLLGLWDAQTKNL